MKTRRCFNLNIACILLFKKYLFHIQVPLFPKLTFHFKESILGVGEVHLSGKECA
jgi:hypothetical protein